MANNRKRLEAIHEMFLSEKAYINDMILWDTEFRRRIISFDFLSPKAKTEICDTIFINMSKIREFHEQVYNQMKSINLRARLSMDPYFIETEQDDFVLDKTKYDDPNILKIEYACTFVDKVSGLALYQEYVSRLPKAEFEIERLCHYSPKFKKGLQDFLIENNLEYLGARNFLYRPSTKMSRVSLLMNAIAKNESTMEYKQKYKDIIQLIKMAVSTVDKNLNEYGIQFKVYRLSQQLSYKEYLNIQIELGIYQKLRKLIKEGDVLLKYDLMYDTILVKIYVFDHAICFCNVTRSLFDIQEILYPCIFAERMIVFIEDLGFNTQQDTENAYSLFILDTSNNKIRTLYFEDELTRQVYYDILRQMVYNNKKNLRSDIKLEKINLTFNSTILTACTSHMNNTEEEYEVLMEQNEISDELDSEKDDFWNQIPENEKKKEASQNLFKKKEIQRAVSGYTKIKGQQSGIETIKSIKGHFGFHESFEDSVEEVESEQDVFEVVPNWIQKICSGTDMFNKAFHYKVDTNRELDIEYLRTNSEMMIVCTTEGIYKIIGNCIPVKIYEGKVDKIIYDTKFELLMFKSNTVLYLAKFNCEMNTIDPKVSNNNIGDFFYGSNTKGSYIATRNLEAEKSSLVFLFNIEKRGENIIVQLSRKLYVGFKVYNIMFDTEKMIVACNSFETVNLETLKTEEFLKRYDLYTPIIFKLVPNSKASEIFRVNHKTYLVCFDSVGFFTDYYGCVLNARIIFLWRSRPLYFKLYYKYLICLSSKWIDIFDIQTGKLIYCDQIYKLKFVGGTHEPIVHDGKCFYKIIL